MKKKRESSEERIERLRQDPDFRALVEILKEQTDEQRERFSERYDDSPRNEDNDEEQERE